MLLPLLAESAPTPPQGTSEWLAVLAFLLWIANSGWHLISRAKGPHTHLREIVNNPLEIAEATQFATTKELKRVERDLDQKIKLLFKKNDQIHDHLTASKDDIMKAGEERLGKLTAQITSVGDALHEKINQLARDVAGHDSDINNLQRETFILRTQKQPAPPQD